MEHPRRQERMYRRVSTLPEPPLAGQCPVEWCLYGRAWGTYIFECARDPYDLVEKYGREPGDGSRMIRVIGSPLQHRHDGHRCIPTTVGYRTVAGRRAITVIERSILAGEQIVVI